MPYDDVVLADTPTRYLKLEDPPGPTALDSSPNAVHGAHSTVGQTFSVPIPQFVNEAAVGITYDGVDGKTFINIPALAYPYATEVFVKDPAQTATSENVVTIVDDTQGYGLLLLTRTITGVRRFYLSEFDQFESSDIISSSVVSPTGLHHVVARSINSNLRELWVDGVLVGTATDPITRAVSSYYFMLGWAGSSSTFSGTLTRAAFYAHDLTPQRIQAHYEAALVLAAAENYGHLAMTGVGQ